MNKGFLEVTKLIEKSMQELCEKRSNDMSKVWQAHIDTLSDGLNPDYDPENFNKKVECTYDDIEKPAHYNQGKIEPIDVIEDWQLPYHLGNVLKYIARSEHKGSKKKDLEKAVWYLQRHIKNMRE